ncbi:MAG TPA: hypothetical protein VK191_08005 [Symbiobacteriaceae bacterium]|nr:hypothetical protein [Symbiobacteriaceae bacterium]
MQNGTEPPAIAQSYRIGCQAVQEADRTLVVKFMKQVTAKQAE